MQAETRTSETLLILELVGSTTSQWGIFSIFICQDTKDIKDIQYSAEERTEVVRGLCTRCVFDWFWWISDWISESP
jgi:hypothetical protein